jgi:glycosyltransferase involved in cell wall biosynthesis
MSGTGMIVYRKGPGVDAIDQYSRRLADAMREEGSEVRYVPDGVSPLLVARDDPDWILLEYNPFSYGRAGIAPRLVRDVCALRRRSRARIVLMVHEAWIGIRDPKSLLVGVWQRAQLRSLLRLADVVVTSTEALARELGARAVHVPVAANVMPVDTTPEAAREHLGLSGRLVVTLFGRGNPARVLDYAEAAIAALADTHGRERIAVLNLGADAPPVRVPDGVDLRAPGVVDVDQLSTHLCASHIVLLPFDDGLSTRRTTLMAALAHGRPVLGLSGRSTDSVLFDAARDGAVALSAAGDRNAFVRAAVEVSADPERLRAIGKRGRRLYAERFDWPVIARRLTALVSAPKSPPDITFVAHNVGGGGGMERHAAELVDGLLDAGHRVTVVAQTCAIEQRPGLRFNRVPTPQRPATIAYPTFFALASLRAARRRGALLHTTGALIANRADVTTVHYCHRAAAQRVTDSRASKSERLYQLNAALSGVLSVAGERWCYRPGRTRLLVAVSEGVAEELRDCFPAMSAVVRTIPNGVDSAVFRPAPETRTQVRSELGVEPQEPVALFVGGDWTRKGLQHAIDALAHAPDWILAVAGHGDREPLVTRARSAGTEPRLRFLGSVQEMPRLYAAADAFVLPTAYEAFPLVTLEAAASGLPLLVTRVNGVEELLDEGRNGWFIARDGADIARRLNELRAAPGLAREMAAGARGAVSRYSWAAMVERYRSVYAELA